MKKSHFAAWLAAFVATMCAQSAQANDPGNFPNIPNCFIWESGTYNQTTTYTDNGDGTSTKRTGNRWSNNDDTLYNNCGVTYRVELTYFEYDMFTHKSEPTKKIFDFPAKSRMHWFVANIYRSLGPVR